MAATTGDLLLVLLVDTKVGHAVTDLFNGGGFTNEVQPRHAQSIQAISIKHSCLTEVELVLLISKNFCTEPRTMIIIIYRYVLNLTRIFVSAKKLTV